MTPVELKGHAKKLVKSAPKATEEQKRSLRLVLKGRHHG